MPNTNIINKIHLPSLAAIILGIIANAPFPPFNFGWTSFFIYAPVISLLYTSKSMREAGWIGGLFGLGFMGAYHFWMFSLDLFAPIWAIFLLWAAFIAYLGLFYAATGAIIYWCRHRASSWYLTPATWVSFEYLRQLGPIGNPAGIVGYGLTDFPHFAIVGALGGVFLVSFLIIMINATIAESRLIQGRKSLYPIGVATLMILMWRCVISPLSHTNPPHTAPPITVTLIQGNHPQMDKFTPALWHHIQQDYIGLTQTSPENSLIIWPETVTPTLMLNNYLLMHQLKSVCNQINSEIILGTPVAQNHNFYNAAIQITPSDTPKIVYQKSKLMPLGEYWPLRPLFSIAGLENILTTDYTSGQQFQPLHRCRTNHIIGISICLESMYSAPFRQQTAQGAQLLVNIANNAWYGSSSAAYKHAQMTRFRAIENQRWVLLCSNTGITQMTSPMGQNYHITPNRTGVLTRTLRPITPMTLYTRYGDWVIWLSLGLVAFRILLLKKKPRLN